MSVISGKTSLRKGNSLRFSTSLYCFCPFLTFEIVCRDTWNVALDCESFLVCRPFLKFVSFTAEMNKRALLTLLFLFESDKCKCSIFL